MKQMQMIVLQRLAVQQEVRKTERLIAQAFPQAPKPVFTNSDYEMLAALEQELRADGARVIFVAVQAENSERSRRHMLRALQFAGGELPADAECFTTADGKHTAFVLRRGGRAIVFVPLCLNALAELHISLLGCLRGLAAGAANEVLTEVGEKLNALSEPLGAFCPLQKEEIVPLLLQTSAEEEYFNQSGAMGGEPPPPVAGQPSLAEIVQLRGRAAANARLEKQLLLWASQLEGRSCLLAIADEFAAVLPLLQELGIAEGLQTETIPPESAVRCEADAVRHARRVLAAQPDALCGVLGSPVRNAAGERQVWLAACGEPDDYAKVRSLLFTKEDATDDAVREDALCAAEAALQLLCEHLKAHGVPPRAASVHALAEAEGKKNTPRRALPAAATASCLVLVTVAATVFFSSQSPRGGAVNTASAPAIVETIADDDYAVGDPAVVPHVLPLGLTNAAAGSDAQAQALLAARGADAATWSSLLQRLWALLGGQQENAQTPGDWVLSLLRTTLGHVAALFNPGLPPEAAVPTTAVHTETTKRTETSDSGEVISLESVTNPTTQRPTDAPTTAAPTTQPPATAAKPPAVIKSITFTAYGYGHGVGMSQEGAIAYANEGWGYKKILLHYYYADGMTLESETVPGTVTHEGKRYGTVEYLARIACGEIGYPGSVPDEAFKAQVVAAYTQAKYNGFKTTNTNQHMESDEKWNDAWAVKRHAKAQELVTSVLGKWLACNGKVAETLYFAASAGKTVSASDVWGGTAHAYLQGGRASGEAVESKVVTFTLDEIRAKVAEYNKAYPSKAITLGSDPSNWFGDVVRDGGGYIKTIRVGDRTLRGADVRSKIFGSKVLRSHCFDLAFGY
jgi:peptidoglycan hydrolase-like amidase